MLHEFVIAQRAEIIARCRAMTSSPPASQEAGSEVDHGVPPFLDQLSRVLQSPLADTAAIELTATAHGKALLRRGFTVVEVLRDYGNLGQAITELASEAAVVITAPELRTLHACVHAAVASAVTEHERLRNHEGSQRLSRLAHELRNQLNSALLAHELLAGNGVEGGGPASAILGRSLSGIQTLIDRELVHVRPAPGTCQPEPTVVCDPIDELQPAATMEAHARGL